MVYSRQTVGNSRKAPECRRINLRRLFEGQIGQVRSLMFVAWIFGAKTCAVVLDVARAMRVNFAIVYGKATLTQPRENRCGTCLMQVLIATA